jgi:LPS-assembly protein
VALATAPQVRADPSDAPIELQVSPVLAPPATGEAARKLPIFLRAARVSGSPDLETTAQGNAEFRRGNTVIRADTLSYDQAQDLAVARGNVSIQRDGSIYSGPELQLKVQRFEGYFLNPTYHFAATGAGGSAERMNFLDEQRVVAIKATYTSCPADNPGGPAWLLTTDRVSLDFGNNEGVAEGGVLRFLGVPILAAPSMSFPLNDERKSGWLPPTIVPFDSTNGPTVAMPYYWNIAPNRDATFTPEFRTRRGPSLNTELRYLEPSFFGNANFDLLPYDALAERPRYALSGSHDSDFGDAMRLQMHWLRVSDENYWKDFPGDIKSLTPRLLSSDLQLSRPFGDWTTYARIEDWQVLQDVNAANRIVAPYERLPQIGARYAATLAGGFEVGLEGEFNHFANPTGATLVPRETGTRVHALGSVAWPYVTPGWTLTPAVSFNAAAYALDPLGVIPAANMARVIPTLSLDSTWVFERDANFFGHAVRQTLEPRIFYVDTPYYNQTALPNFDASAKDFSFDSIFTTNSFSGVDRVSDAHQVTAGVTTRILDPQTGEEQLRLGIAQRYLLRSELVTPQSTPLPRGFSDVLLVGSTKVIPSWVLESSVQYSPENDAVTSSLVSVRYLPGPFHTLNFAYRYTRGLTEQVELGWQWPLWGRTPDAAGGARRSAGEGRGDCKGTWYGVGHVDYSTIDRRIINGIAGFEYDAGCWIGRIVATRQSTSLSEASTRVMIQLELVGLSRLGSNPLQALKDNIPGYRLLRDERTVVQPSSDYD